VTKHAIVDGIEDLLETVVDQDAFVGVLVTDVLNVLSQVSEQEDVVLANLSGDLDIGTVASTDDETTVEDEFHVRSTRSLSTGSGDVLTDIRGRGNDLTLGHIVVLDEDDLERIANLRIVVDDSANFVDKMDDTLSHPVAGSSLATKDGDSRLHLLSLFGRHGLESQIAVNDTEDVKLLTLVLVNTLDLDIEQSCRVDLYAGSILDVVGKASFVGILDVLESLTELLVIGVGLNLVQEGKVLEEVVATKLGSDELGQLRVGLVQPAARSDTVGDVGEFVLTVNLDEVLEDGGLDQIRMQLGDTIDLVRAYNGKEGHADHLGVRLLDNGDTGEHVAILGEGALDVLQEV